MAKCSRIGRQGMITISYTTPNNEALFTQQGGNVTTHLISIMKAAHFSIPRGFRPRYIPCLDEECQVLLDQLEETGNTEVADHLIESFDAARCRRWEETTKQMNFTKSSRNSWSLIRRLGAAQNPPRTSHPPVKADAVASHLLHIARVPVKKHKCRVQVEGRYFLPTRSRQKLTSSLHCRRNLPGAAEYESWHRSRL